MEVEYTHPPFNESQRGREEDEVGINTIDHRLDRVHRQQKRNKGTEEKRAKSRANRGLESYIGGETRSFGEVRVRCTSKDEDEKTGGMLGSGKTPIISNLEDNGRVSTIISV